MDTQLTVRIPSKLAVHVKKTARRLGLKRSDVVRLALQEFVGADKVELPSLYEKVAPLLGSFKSGISDLGENHRAHLIKRIKNA